MHYLNYPKSSFKVLNWYCLFPNWTKPEHFCSFLSGGAVTLTFDDHELLSLCSHEVEVRSFPTSGSVFNGRYKLMSKPPDGSERGVWKGVAGPTEDYCIWWHAPYRHWWIGNCRKVGNNHGYAWLLPSEAQCPSDGGQGQWRRGGTDAILNVGQIISIDSKGSLFLKVVVLLFNLSNHPGVWSSEHCFKKSPSWPIPNGALFHA